MRLCVCVCVYLRSVCVFMCVCVTQTCIYTFCMLYNVHVYTLWLFACFLFAEYKLVQSNEQGIAEKVPQLTVKGVG